MSSTVPTVSVIIVNYNSGDRLARCLDHLYAQSFDDFDVYVVDNGSSDDSIAKAANSSQRFTLIDAEQNLGFAAANNLAVVNARGAWVAFLNPDAYAEKDWLDHLMLGAKKYPWAQAFGSTQIDAANNSLLDGAGDVATIYGVAYRGHYGWPVESTPEDGECFSPCAAAACYRRDRFLELGGFDERFFCYGEDVDLGFRLRLSGGRAVQLKAARVAHEGSGVAGRHSDFTVYHGHRNRIWLYYKNLPAPVYWLTAPLRWAADLGLLVKAVFAGYGAAYVRALRDGYGGLSAFRTEKQAKGRKSAPGSSGVWRLLVWSPLALLRRKSVPCSSRQTNGAGSPLAGLSD